MIAVGGGVSVLVIVLNIAVLVILLTQRTKIKAMKGKWYKFKLSLCANNDICQRQGNQLFFHIITEDIAIGCPNDVDNYDALDYGSITHMNDASKTTNSEKEAKIKMDEAPKDLSHNNPDPNMDVLHSLNNPYYDGPSGLINN